MAVVEVTVLFFAKARELVGASSSTCRLPTSSISVEQLTTALLVNYPELARLGGAFVISLNEQYLEGSVSLQQGDELAIIPPISGG